ncbi:hypothetical protein FNF27_06344 [Cafeteria roenbergensis]|uniref:Uncharacterized protein n=1 Tax=Cafeteria roenbergensis TaxID=33653 RepID=A0A5A8E0E4_CAFRO|nr:hypothetical protein FNF27_06344 [Cafeteria roenbergensis]
MSGSNPAGAANFKRQSWDKAEYEERARRRQQMIEEAVRSGADDEDVTARIMEAERLIGTQARGETATAEELRERAVKALSASAGAAGPMASERAWLHRRKFDVSIDDKVGTRKIVTESTGVNNRGGFYVPVTGVTLSNSIAFLDHINGRKYQQALGYSMRVERKGADDVSSKLRALRAQSRAEEENAAALAAAKASGQDIGREVYNRRVAAAEEEEEARRQRERERRRQRRRRKYGHVDDGDDDIDDDDEAVDGAADGGTDTVSLDLFVMTYGAIVSQMMSSFEDPARVNTELAKLGDTIGSRIADDFLSKAEGVRCRSFREAMTVIAKNAFPTYLGVAADPEFSFTRAPAAGGTAATECSAPAEGGRELECCTLTMEDNPLARWVELPEGAEDLRFSNLLCGVIQGAMAAIMYKVEATFSEDTLRGDARNRIKVVLSQVLKDTAAEEYRAE